MATREQMDQVAEGSRGEVTGGVLVVLTSLGSTKATCWPVQAGSAAPERCPAVS